VVALSSWKRSITLRWHTPAYGVNSTNLGVEISPRDQGELDPPLDVKRELCVVSGGERLGPDHAVADDLGRRAVSVRRRLAALRAFLQKACDGELDCFRTRRG
jgi:hypothetical protein